MTHDDTDDPSLFDPSLPQSAEVERLGRLLRPAGLRDGAAPVALPRARRSPRLLVPAVAAAAFTSAVVWFAGPPAPKELAPPQSVTEMLARRQEQDFLRKEPAQPATSCMAEGSFDLAPGQWLVTGDEPREIAVAGVSSVTMSPRTRLQVKHVRDDEARLFLAEGRIEARVSADARPRFFQVDTDAARCVDLGCRYTLDVDGAGTATVRVTTGQVAFENDGREVFVPSGAVCVARKGSGAGTPRFEDASAELKAAFDAYDAAAADPPERRRALATAALATVAAGRDTLAAWHVLADADAQIARAANARLAAVAGDAPKSEGAALREVWRTRLSASW